MTIQRAMWLGFQKEGSSAEGADGEVEESEAGPRGRGVRLFLAMEEEKESEELE